ncbi:alkaline shock response membrane anchor protein AmaP [Pseudonocardia sp. C8]|uniref:alkaline shock response membrane anchor protein AmaP n=1 Tax=Pseudonocardia sp. C8 TaxID=2762759 RepID=UPI001643472B|nr:alkaline shock response membrane anchor protein AmaP [Pseudonocardia sp. C8]MBC3191436.1 alkaline shock response membrane anchor protein AmaP [Pseudonocardia sp. C8]
MSADTTPVEGNGAGRPQPPDDTRAAAPAHPRKVAKAARKAQYRSAGGARWGLTLLGLALLAAGVLTVLLVAGVFGRNRPQRPLLDPVIQEFLVAQATVARIVAIVAGLLLLVLGLLWAARSLRPEPRPDVVLDDGAGTAIRIHSAAAADAVADGAAGLPGVTRARARMVGSTHSPAVRATVWIDEDIADDEVAELCRRLDAEVLAQVRDALGRPDLPVAVRLELDSGRHAGGPRVT